MFTCNAPACVPPACQSNKPCYARCGDAIRDTCACQVRCDALPTVQQRLGATRVFPSSTPSLPHRCPIPTRNISAASAARRPSVTAVKAATSAAKVCIALPAWLLNAPRAPGHVVLTEARRPTHCSGCKCDTFGPAGGFVPENGCCPEEGCCPQGCCPQASCPQPSCPSMPSCNCFQEGGVCAENPCPQGLCQNWCGLSAACDGPLEEEQGRPCIFLHPCPSTSPRRSAPRPRRRHGSRGCTRALTSPGP